MQQLTFVLGLQARRELTPFSEYRVLLGLKASLDLMKCKYLFRSRWLYIRKRVPCEDPFLDRFPIDEVFLHEPRDAVNRHAHIPRSFRIDHHDRPSRTDSETLHLRSIACRGSGSEGKVSILQLGLEFLPGHLSNLTGTARIANAQKNMSTELPDQQFVLCNFCELLFGFQHLQLLSKRRAV
jgi:hypothetical protein